MFLKVAVCLSVALALEVAANRCKLSNLQNYQDKIYSQYGEDGVLLRVLEAVGTTNKMYVEFGVSDGVECNCRILREHLNFTGLMMDGDHEQPEINLRKEFITTDNVLSIFQKYEVPLSFDVLSLDVDMFDWWILTRLLRDGGYRPRVVVVETNPTLGILSGKLITDLPVMNTMPLTVMHPNLTNQRTWDLSRYCGANPLAFERLGNAFGYDMVYCELCGVNCIMVLRDAVPLSCKSLVFSWSLHYPCFGTMRTNGAYPGHEVDPMMRRPVLISDNFLGLVVSGSYTLKDVVDQMISPTEQFPLWGSDWCYYLFENPFNENGIAMEYPEDVKTVKQQFDIASMYFEHGYYNKAAEHFQTIVAQLYSLGYVCHSRHWSEDNCRLSAIVNYNLGVSVANAASVGDRSLLKNVSSILKKAEFSVSLGHGNSRIRDLSEFISQIVSINDFNKLTTVWLVLEEKHKRLRIDICSDYDRLAQLFCIENNLPDESCDIISKHLRDVYGESYRRYPGAFGTVADEGFYMNQNMLPLVDESHSFYGGGCFQSFVNEHVALVSQYCRDVTQISKALVLVSGFASNAVIRAGEIIIEKMLGMLKVEGSPNAGQKSQLSKLNQKYLKIEAAARSLLQAAGCSFNQGAIHAALADTNCLTRLLAGPFSSQFEKNAMSDILNFIHKSIYDELRSVVVHGDSFLPYTHLLWREVFQGRKNDVHFVILAPPIELAIAGMAEESNISTQVALEKFIEYTNSIIRIFSANGMSKSVVVLTCSENDVSAAAEILDRIPEVSGKLMTNSTNFMDVVALLSDFMPMYTKRQAVQIPFWFYKCYEGMRTRKSLPTEPCTE